jgi:hypothetical protein
LKELAAVPPKDLAITLPKELVKSTHPQSYYARAIPCLKLAPPPPRFTVGESSKPKAPTFRVPKELNLLPPRPNETLVGLKTNKFGDATCMKYQKITPRVTLDGVRASPDQIKVVPPKKKPSPPLEPKEPKHQKTTIASLEKRIEELERSDAQKTEDLAFLARKTTRMVTRIDKGVIKYRGLKSYVDIIARTIAKEIDD